LRMMPPLLAWAQAVTLMVVGTQAMVLPPAFLPTPLTIKKETRKDEAEPHAVRPLVLAYFSAW
jgi:hypothetical protein